MCVSNLRIAALPNRLRHSSGVGRADRTSHSEGLAIGHLFLRLGERVGSRVASLRSGRGEKHQTNLADLDLVAVGRDG